MKLKLDENLPLSAASSLRRRGHDVDTVVDEGLGGGHDDDVVAKATAESRLLITLDRGLGDVRRYPPGSHSGILVLRVEDQSAQSVVSRLEAVVDHHAIEALSGAVAVAQRGVLRIRQA